MLAGPLLARFKKAYIPQPGGDKIGRRRLDTHILGFEKLGATYTYNEEQHFFTLEANQLVGNYMLLDEPSVTGTANILMAAICAKGKTRIYNAACEPYLQQLCRLLNRMGASISGIGSNLLTIKGIDAESLVGCEHTILADMIEVGSFIGLAAMTGGDILIKNCNVKYLGCIPETFQRLGIQLEIIKDDIHIPAQEHYKIQRFIGGDILTIYDHPWPGFTPDLLSIALVVATQAKGTVLFHQKMFESRLFFTDKLIDMGAQIVLCDPHRAVVVGLDKQSPLRGNTMSSPDIRAGLALLIAALSAQGKSIIQNGEQIDRGYQNIDIRLQQLGAKIRRID
jgi:UDP-N-acetylglucosamine 1-carboxyvinyltransferase